MTMISPQREAVAVLCDIVGKLGTSFPTPQIVRRGNGFVDRHDGPERTYRLVCYLKAVKVCSTLNGLMLLIDNAYVQEAYALARIAQDQIDDIRFLVAPRGKEGQVSERQALMINEFFEEEFDSSDPIGSSNNRDRVPRAKIHAAITNDMSNPSTGNAILRMIYRMFSGYVHGAYVHIMELHDDSGKYAMAGTPRHMADAIDYTPNFLYQAVLAVEMLVDRTSRKDLMPAIKSLRIDISERFDVLPQRK